MQSTRLKTGRRARRKQETREALLDAALALFGKRGIYETRVEDVTERADVGKGAFYNYFPSKAALIADLIAAGVERFASTYLGGDAPPARLADRLSVVVNAHDRFFKENPQYAIVFHQARGLLELDSKAAPVLRKVFGAYLDRLARYLLPRAGASAEVSIEAAVAVAGCIAGYRSFANAAGIVAAPARETALLVGGIPLLARER